MNKNMFGIIILMSFLVSYSPSVSSAENISTPKGDIDFENLLMFETVNKQIARFVFFSDYNLDLYVYLQTEEEHQMNKNFSKRESTFFTLSNSMPLGSFYDELKEKNTNKRVFYSVRPGFELESESKYYYKIMMKNGPIIKEGSFVSKPSFDKATYPDISVLENYLEIDYLNGTEYSSSRQAGFYAALRAKYFDRTVYDGSKKIVEVTFYNAATNITLISRHGLMGFWPESGTPTGPYLTKNEYKCYFRNGENPITVTIKSNEISGEVNKNNNFFIKTIFLSGVESMSGETCTIDGKIFAAKMRIEDKNLSFYKDFSNNNSRNLTYELSNGRLAEMKVVPETASATATERLGELEFNVTLKEVGSGEETKVVYNLETTKEVKLFGFIKKKAKIEVEVDAENDSKIISIKRPWWAFLASGF